MATPQVKALSGMTPLGLSEMSQIELLANDIAFLSNDNLAELAEILVRDYTPRANVMEAVLNNSLFDHDMVNMTNDIDIRS
jgi:hypothetical protein